MFDNYYLNLMAQNNLSAIRFLDKQDTEIEKEVKKQCRLKKEFSPLLTIPGIGEIIAMTIMLEVGDIRRFSTVGDYVSYCRCAKSEKMSNDKKKGKNNAKNGNRYLSWAYVEAANYCIRYCKRAEKFYQRKLAQSKSKALAIKALSGKLARASYYIMRDGVSFDETKLFS
jgi:transposase